VAAQEVEGRMRTSDLVASTVPAIRPLLAGIAGCLVCGCGDAPERAATKAVVRAVERLGGKVVIAAAAAPGDRPGAVRRIDLAHTAVTDADLTGLAALAAAAGGPLDAVEELDLTHTAVGDRGVAAVAALPAIRKLSLTLTRVGDAGLGPLARLERLTELYLAETSLTDEAVAALERLAGLRVLVLLRTGVSDAGVARLRRALPEATIQVEPAAARRRQRSPTP